MKQANITYFPIEFITFIVFLILKLCGVIDWSWWWITAPLWGALILGIILGCFYYWLKNN